MKKYPIHKSRFALAELLIVMTIIAFLQMLMVPKARAGLQTLNLGTNSVAGSSASNFVATPFTITTTSDPTLQLSSACTGTNTSTQTWTFDGSVDNTIWASNVLAFSYTANGTNVAGVITNLPPGFRYPFIRFDYYTNANGNTALSSTNLNAKLFTKPGI